MFKQILQKAKFQQGKTEEQLAEKAGISRLTLRQISGNKGNPTLASLSRLAEALDCRIQILIVPEAKEVGSDCSTVAVSQKVLFDGFESWPLHFMELVDQYRKTLDPRLFLLPPVRGLDLRLKALLASITLELCLESDSEVPEWAQRSYFLEKPWFVSARESLKASALLECPLNFRRNNIFVQSNFLTRV